MAEYIWLSQLSAQVKLPHRRSLCMQERGFSCRFPYSGEKKDHLLFGNGIMWLIYSASNIYYCCNSVLLPGPNGENLSKSLCFKVMILILHNAHLSFIFSRLHLLLSNIILNSVTFKKCNSGIVGLDVNTALMEPIRCGAYQEVLKCVRDFWIFINEFWLS